MGRHVTAGNLTPAGAAPAPRRGLGERLLHRLLHRWWRLRRGMTLGVRGLVVDPDGRVFLVRHSYLTGWYLPGGGVEVGETMETSLARELLEEGNLHLDGPAVLHGVYLNDRVSRRDHVALYVVRAFRQPAPFVPTREILEAGFFASDALPDGTSPATRARIAEILHGAPRSAHW